MCPLPSRGTLQPGDAMEEPPLAAGCAPCHPEWRQGSSWWPRPDPLGAGGAPGACGAPGLKQKAAGGCRPPLHPLCTRSILGPDRWALPCGRGAVLPGRAGEMAFRRAWSGIQHRSLVPRQRSIRPVISRAQGAAGAWAGRGAGKCQAGRGCPRARDAPELAQLTHPTLHIHRPFPASVSHTRAGVEAVPA